MFDVEKEKEKALKKHKEELALIEKCKGIEKHVQFVCHPYIYIRDYTYKEYVKALREISATLKVKRELIKYYCSTLGWLMIDYKFGDSKIVFTCIETEKTLEKLGRGRCRIVEKTETTKSVVCDV